MKQDVGGEMWGELTWSCTTDSKPVRCCCRGKSPLTPQTNKIRDEFVERDAGTRGYAYLPRICDSNTPPAVLDFRCSVSMTSMNKKGKKNEENLVKIVGIERCERAG